MLYEVNIASVLVLKGTNIQTGLAETLQSEFMLYGIDVHAAFPGTMYTQGFEQENACKPKITRKVEETDGGAQPEVVARVILDGA